ncbi:hypothetical protein LRP50_05045 [Enterovibrio sp. ZSDZ42]|uniref:Uncharacterized protein n=1 Tax=Enterovibrio gelatinilyticus TaxID=2899819 RepID=A0ABT5QWU9_9GAMM|nr:hypothetical protein [Enterovibrio sp. ZSDZ42]MDD1792493.1 hypothetical protein [Enterovibrio sp. ZSDZ42]
MKKLLLGIAVFGFTSATSLSASASGASAATQAGPLVTCEYSDGSKNEVPLLLCRYNDSDGRIVL